MSGGGRSTTGSSPANRGFDDAALLSDRFREHFGDSTHVYARAMTAMADDYDAGGVVREIFRGWEDAPPGTVPQLRVLAAVFAIVLRGEAPALAAFYPVLGGTRPPSDVWPALHEVLVAHQEEVRQALETAPQTNEAGRSLALLAGIFEAVRRTGLSTVRLLEVGASAGLNLNVDRFRFEGGPPTATGPWEFGPPGAALLLRDGIHGRVVPEPFTVVERRGCDLEPVDASTEAGRLRLVSFTWPFHEERHRRLRAALAVAQEYPVTVDRAPAAAWLEDRLAASPEPGVLTVVWQSITRQYWPPQEVAHVDRVLATARGRMPLAHVAMEYPQRGAGHAELTLNGDVLGTVGDHGAPVVLTGIGPLAYREPHRPRGRRG